MKVLQINSTFGLGSTGKICSDISLAMSRNGINNKALYTIGRANESNAVKCANTVYTKIQAAKSLIIGNYGFNSNLSTKKMIQEIEGFQPDIVHLHNIHSHDCNLELLFNYFRTNEQKLVWTLHDCWAFTGYCPHFSLSNCDKWKTCCKQCPQSTTFSMLNDKSSHLYLKKKRLLAGLNLSITVPSHWMEGTVRKSFLQKYPIVVINNGIDLNTFKPVGGNFRDKYNIPTNKKMLLGVAFDWGYGKGLDVFVELAERLDPQRYQIVLVGINQRVRNTLPNKIIALERTQNQQELAEMYSSADLFINPTREEVFGLVNAESLACGTPVLTFNTGGCPEIVTEKCGSVVDVDDVDSLLSEIIHICNDNPFSDTECVARAQMFNKEVICNEYITLYRSLYE